MIKIELRLWLVDDDTFKPVSSYKEAIDEIAGHYRVSKSDVRLQRSPGGQAVVFSSLGGATVYEVAPE